MTDKKTKVRVTTYSFQKVDAIIESVRKDGESLKNKIHSLGVCILKHWHDHPSEGAATADKINALIAVAGYHAKPFAKWVQEMTPYRWSEENKGFYVHTEDKVMGKAFMAARDTPFWEVSPPPEVKGINSLDEVNALIGRLLKRDQNAKEQKGVFSEDDVIDLKLIRRIREAVAEHTASTSAA